jgi:hypothetical protein
MAPNDNHSFAAMDADQRRAIASGASNAAHADAGAHEWDPEEATAADHLGGLAAHHHTRAAYHHESAALHHARAAAHCAAGANRQADMHTDNATKHERSARFHAEQAQLHAQRGMPEHSAHAMQQRQATHWDTDDTFEQQDWDKTSWR